MAPDVNSLSQSPRQDQPPPPQPLQQSSQPASATASRRASASRQMPPPPAPMYGHPPSHRSPTTSGNEYPGVPMRHPRPLTAAELYDQCEKEQEAVVNRLTRELTALRAQSASVASNASHSSTSTSASLLPVDIGDPNPAHQLTGATHPTPSRQRRSSSSLSARSTPHTPSTSASVPGSSISTQAHAGSITASHGCVSQASADRAAAGHRSISRQPSVSASGTSTPARASMDIQRAPGSYTLPIRPSLSRDASCISQTTTASSTAAHAGTPRVPPGLESATYTPTDYTFATPPPGFGLNPPLSPATTSRAPQSATTAAGETAPTEAYRTEMEIVKAENEALRHRVRALERALSLQARRRRDSSNSETARASARDVDGVTVVGSPEMTRATISVGGVAAWAGGNDGGVGGVAGPRERSESQSTTASSRRGGGGVGLQGEDEVRLGESAGSVGIGRGI